MTVPPSDRALLSHFKRESKHPACTRNPHRAYIHICSGIIAFIDGQNLYSAVMEAGWLIDFRKLRRYLQDKYNITEAYHFFGYRMEEYQVLYTALREAGFIVRFKYHTPLHTSEKRGNVDTAMVFSIMRRLLKEPDSFDKVVLVTGDFCELVEFLIEEGRMEKVLHPTEKNVSSLYKNLGSEYFDFLENPVTRSKIEKRKEDS